jgi:hypothetical protein
MALALHPPFAPMEALSVDTIPTGPAWQYEPKWDGFRCLLFRDGDKVELQSKAGKPLTRYFPEIVAAAQAMDAKRFVLDGETWRQARPEPLVDGALDRMATARAQARGRGLLRPLLGRPLSLRHAPAALAAGQGADAMHDGAGAAEERGFDEVARLKGDAVSQTATAISRAPSLPRPHDRAAGSPFRARPAADALTRKPPRSPG